MNQQHRSLWNNSLGAFVAAPEHSAARGKRGPGRPGRTARRALALAAALACAGLAQAGPQGGQVTAGSGSINSPNATTTTVTQTSPRLAINWQSFNTTTGETVNFVQPGSHAVALNRVLGSNGTQFLGRLNANGQVFVIDPNGVLFGKTAQVNVGGLVASTLNLSDSDFMAGKLRFTGNGSGNGGSVVNQGSLTAADGGYVALLGGQVSNSGTVTARLGSVALAAGHVVTLDFAGDGLLNVAVDQGVLNALASNSGQISADGGSALLTAKAAGDLIGTVVNNTGVIQARTLQSKAGVIKLLGDFGGGTVQVSGTLDASAPIGGDGGLIETSATKVKVDDAALITTLASIGTTGNWLIDPTDYTVAPSGGDTTGAAVSTRLASTSVTLQTTSASGGHGDIFINDAITWNAPTTLSLWAGRHIVVNQPITSNHSSGKVALWLGRDAPQANNTADYSLSAPIHLRAGPNLTVQTGSDGTATTYQVITNLGAVDSTTGVDLQGMQTQLHSHYALGADIDASATAGWNLGVGFQPIPNVSGVFAGLGHRISGLTIGRAGERNVGLLAANTGTVRDLRLSGGLIVGFESVGAVVGVNSGVLRAVVSDAEVLGFGTGVGGLAGVNNATGNIGNSAAMGKVSNSAPGTGGLVGVSRGAIARSYAASPQVAGGNSAVGGLLGQMLGGSIDESYSTSALRQTWGAGLVGSLQSGTVTRSFYDNRYGPSGQAGTGKAAAELRQLATFTAAGWNIAGSGGSSATWRLYEGQTTPLLRSLLQPLSVGGGTSTAVYNGVARDAPHAELPNGASTAHLFNLEYSGVDAGTYRSPSYSDQFGYDITDNRLLTITPKAITTVRLNNPDKVYDGTTAASVEYRIDVAPRDAVTATGTANYADKNVGNNKAVTATGLALVGTGAGNYTLTATTASTTGTITKASISAVTDIIALNRGYNGGTAATLNTAFATFNGKFGNDLLTVDRATGAFSDKNAGVDKPVTITGITLGGSDAGNYQLLNRTASTTANINKANLTAITGITANSKTYDAKTTATLNTSNASVSGRIGTDELTVTGAAGTFSDKNVGTAKTVTISGFTFGGADAGNYAFSGTASTTANVTPKTLTVTGLLANSKPYDGTTRASVNTSRAALGGVLPGDNVAVGLVTGNFATATLGYGKAVTVTAVPLAGTDAGNYQVLQLPTGLTANITTSALCLRERLKCLGQ